MMNRKTTAFVATTRRHLSTSSPPPNLTHLSNPIDLAHLTSLKSNSELLASYSVTPPIHPWPRSLSSKRLAALIRRAGSPTLAVSIFHHAAQFVPNFTPTYPAYHALISRLAAARAFPLLPPILDSLRRSQLKCGEDAFIDLIRAFSLSSRPNSALKTFLSLPSFNLNASVRSFNALLNAMIQNRRLELVGPLFKNCQSRFGIAPNVFTCNILIKALCKMSNIEGALELLDKMPEWGMVPNLVTFTTIIAAHFARGQIVDAQKLFDEILNRGFKPDVTAYTVLIDGYCRNERLVDAVRIMDDMEVAGVAPNEITYAVVIEACCEERKSGEALNLIQEMIEGGRYVPSSSLCCKVIDLLCEDGKVEDACEIWKKLLRKNVTPDNSISSALIYWLCKKGNVREARKLFAEFERGFIPSLLTYNTLISGMCENGELQEAGRLWDDMVERRCAPNVFTYNVLIKGFCKAGKAKEGVRFFEEMLRKRCVPNKFTYGILVDGLFESGDEEEAVKVLHSAALKGGQYLDKDSWDVFVKKVVTDCERWKEDLSMALFVA